MATVIGGVLLVLFVLGIGPATRGTAAAIQSFEDPGKPETQEERDRANSDLVRLLMLLAAVFGLMFVWKMGG
ncbi:MAG: hypothetical protein U0X20_27500 [Caldilineaceae bacterium]